MSSKKAENFKADLKALLEKYNASIGWDCHWSSDLHGVYDQEMNCTVGGETIKLTDGCDLDSTDIYPYR